MLNRSLEPMTPKEVSDALGAKYNNTKKLMFTMLGDGQLLKDGKGRYSPANPTTPGNSGNPSGNPNNRRADDTYGDNGSRVTEVTVECIHGVVGGCWMCKKARGPSDRQEGNPGRLGRQTHPA